MIPLVNNMVQNKAKSNDDTVLILDYVDENLLEIESSDNDNQDSDHKSGT